MTNIIDNACDLRYNQAMRNGEAANMLADIAQRYYMQDYNCAESVLLAADEAYGLGLAQGAHRLLSAFGGGMGCGGVCGALAGSLAALGQAAVAERAHATPDFRALCAGCVSRFEAALGGRDCAQLKPLYFAETTRCLQTVRRAADALEAQMDALRNA